MNSEKLLCKCGSGEKPWWLTDARGIPVARVCKACVAKVKAKYRPEIFTNRRPHIG
jgi:hypothetical protein